MLVDLHVGFQKTGTTSLQAMLEANRDRLKATFVNYDDRRLRPLIRACRRFEKRRDEPSAKAITEATRQLVAGLTGDHVVITSESLSGPTPTPSRVGSVYQMTPEILFRIKQGAGDATFRFHLGTRSEGKWLSSLYRHVLRTRGIAMDEATFRALPAFAAFRFETVCNEIRSRIGELNVWRMEDDLNEVLGPGTGFLCAIGVSKDDLQHWKKVSPRNQGLTPKAVAILTSPVAMALPILARRILSRFVTMLIPESRGGATG